MDLASILAAHRRKALERIAERDSSVEQLHQGLTVATVTKLDADQKHDRALDSSKSVMIQATKGSTPAGASTNTISLQEDFEADAISKSEHERDQTLVLSAVPTGGSKDLAQKSQFRPPLQAVNVNSMIPFRPQNRMPGKIGRDIGASNHLSIRAYPQAMTDTRQASTPTFGGHISSDSEGSDDSVGKMLGYLSIKDKKDISMSNQSTVESQMTEYKTAPIFSRAVDVFLQPSKTSKQSSTVFRQYGLLGYCKNTGTEVDTFGGDRTQKSTKGRFVFANMDAPWSAFICGSQGAGKSHTLSCLLENGLLAKSDVNKLPEPLAALVFHYDKFTGNSSTQLCEAAYLCSAGIPVTVLVSPSNIWNMKEMYTNLPGLPADSPRPKVLPLYLKNKNLTTSTLMKLMRADSKTSHVPLYITVVRSILQEMAMQGHGTGTFSYGNFKQRLANHRWLHGQRGPLDMRLNLLEAFLEPSELTRSTRPAPAKEDIWAFEQGSLTIVDLSDSFIDENDACTLFSICLSVFMESRGKTGQIVALDEAHKFLTQSGEAEALTEDLTSIIRQQRHTGTRVLIATQEPTLSPKLMDLANVTIVHRFLSPDWYETIKRHIAAAKRYDGAKGTTLFETIVGLETGEALVFCPTAILTLSKSKDGTVVNRLGNDYVQIQIRKRQTMDGGRSVMALDTLSTVRKSDSAVNVPMFVVTRPVSTAGIAPTGTAAQVTAQVQCPPQTNVQATAAVPPVAEIQQVVKKFVKNQFSKGWESPGNIGWRAVYHTVETHFNWRDGSIGNSFFYRDVCHKAAKAQVNECRVAYGWDEL